jgi:hypothetical protein
VLCARFENKKETSPSERMLELLLAGPWGLHSPAGRGWGDGGSLLEVARQARHFDLIKMLGAHEEGGGGEL